eukprot:SAG31_NODE_4506_length_3179_cov_1.712338_3_plen_81_part_00
MTAETRRSLLAVTTGLLVFTHRLQLCAGAGAAVRVLPDGHANPVANPASVVLCDAHSRITVLSPLLVRAEFSSSGTFEDR